MTYSRQASRDFAEIRKLHQEAKRFLAAGRKDLRLLAAALRLLAAQQRVTDRKLKAFLSLIGPAA
jgi:hypothetical protein